MSSTCPRPQNGSHASCFHGFSVPVGDHKLSSMFTLYQAPHREHSKTRSVKYNSNHCNIISFAFKFPFSYSHPDTCCQAHPLGRASGPIQSWQRGVNRGGAKRQNSNVPPPSYQMISTCMRNVGLKEKANGWRVDQIIYQN